MGRYYAMDRDKRHDRIKIAYEGLVQVKGEKCSKSKIIQVRVYHRFASQPPFICSKSIMETPEQYLKSVQN